MLLHTLEFNLDLVLFADAVILATWLVHRWIRRASRASGAGVAAPGLPGKAWLTLIALIAAGCWLAHAAGEQARLQLRQMVEGFAPTYAAELSRLGHEKVKLDTSPDDPTYLQLIEAQKRWLSLNPAVNDVYTFRAGSDGHLHLVVDSETDYDRDGRYDGDREKRTAIGEVYDEEPEAWNRALAGERFFDDNVTVDRWGEWVSAVCPIYGPDGKVEAGVGVDFDASRWVTAILIRRLGVLGFFAVAVAIVIWTGGLLVLARHEASSRLAAERRIKTILDNEPEGVFVCDADGTLRQANPSGLHLLELSAADDWRSKALPAYVPDAERAATDAWLKAVAAGRAGTQLVRLVGTRGGEKWVDAHAVPLRDWTDESTGERRDGVLIVARDVTAARAAEAERDRLQQQLMDASRRAGMAEVATGVLHNVGNVLNTVNISTHMLADKLRQSRVPRLGQAAEMLQQHRAQLGVFLTADERGRQFPDYLEKLSGSLRQEQEEMLSTVRSLSEALDHLKAIVQSQQSFAANVNVVETVRATAVFEEALKLNISSCERHHVKVEREFEDDLPPVTIDKHKTLQILINLISNAKNAIKASPNQAERQITLRLSRGTSGGAPTVRFQVKDNGVGIAPENLTKVFGMGFTTRKDGHGFGLHSSANFANEMGGRLTVSSEGVGLGAAFCLELPVVPPATQPLHEQRHHAGAVREAA